jgi:hypothetical protein
MARTYLDSTSGEIAQKQAANSSAGVADADKIIATDSAGLLPISMLPVGVGVLAKSIVTSENLAARDLVNIYNNAGTPTARKADADNNMPVHGYVLNSSTSPAAATVYFDGIIPGFTGLTRGARQYLSATAGARTETPPSGSGNLVQYLGIAISDTELEFDPADYVRLA